MEQAKRFHISITKGHRMSQAVLSMTYKNPEWTPIQEDDCLEDSSPFGLQGLARDSLQILKPDCINRLAAHLALRATRAQIKDPNYINRVLNWHPEWVDEYQVVHLIEKSLWIQGHSDLVMTMIRNPSQIPDNPPRKIIDALSRAYVLHPEAAIWYGVPLFSEEKNEEGLPIPVTASEVRAEALKRIEAAQRHALRWQWAYRSAVAMVSAPTICWNAVRARIQTAKSGVAQYWRQAREDARERARAIFRAEQQRCRFGESSIEIPEHRTWLGKNLESTYLFLEVIANQAEVVSAASPWFLTFVRPLTIAGYIPVLFLPLPFLVCDPFLFVELPDEPGKLRHLGHWYWQTTEPGKQKLHLHV
jgi:hypothetical protein